MIFQCGYTKESRCLIIKVTRLRQKKIGKKFQIVLAPYTKETARIHIHEYDDSKRKWIKHIIGVYSNTANASKALSVYNSTKTVGQINKLLKRR